MKPEKFTTWLKGLLDGVETKTLSEFQLNVIRNHLKLVEDEPEVSITSSWQEYKFPEDDVTITATVEDVDYSKVKGGVSWYGGGVEPVVKEDWYDNPMPYDDRDLYK